MKFKEFLIALGLDRRLDIAEATEAGTCSIEFDNQVTIHIESDKSKGLVQAYCIVGQAPATHRDALFAMLLQAHMFGTATDSCAFGFQPQQDQIILFKTIDLAYVDPATATKQLESLVNQSLRWATYLPHLLEDWDQKVVQTAVDVAQASLATHA